MIERAVIINTLDSDNPIPVLFNPEEYSINRENNYAQTAIPGLSAPLTQFVNGNAQTLEMELLIDTFEEHIRGSKVINKAGEDVRKLSNQIVGLMDINPEIHAPPICHFSWGESFVFTCVLARVSQKFIKFRPDGTPVRCRLNVTFNQFQNTENEARETKRETADYTKHHIVQQGESLSDIAFSHYGNPALWRSIALHNQLSNPQSMAVGTHLAIPRLPFTDPETGIVYQ